VPVVKKAISLDEDLFTRAEDIAHEMHVSRSRLIAIALEDFVRRQESKRLTEQFSAVYADDSQTEEEKANMRSMRRRHREIVRGEWE
jgi:predicted transcriptional regulator